MAEDTQDATSPATWWFRLTLATALPISYWRISDSTDSKAYETEVVIKLVAIGLLSVIYYVLVQLLCNKENSFNGNTRDPSYQYGVLRPNERFEWIADAHSKYIKTQIADNSAYTVLRTVERYWIFQLEMHYLRLLTTVHQHPANKAREIQISPKVLRKLLVRHLRTGLDTFYGDDVVESDEARIMICIDSGKLFKSLDTDSKFRSKLATDKTKEKAMTEALESSLVIHFGALPDLKRPISACIRIGRHIFNADSPEKSTKWAKDRKRFQKEIDSKLGLNEVLMTEIVRRDDSVQREDKDHYDGYVMEGLSSNVAMLMEDNTLLTPSTEMGILPGTVRGFLIDLMERRNSRNGQCRM